MSGAAEWCTTSQAAARLGVTRPTVIAWLGNGTLRGQVDSAASRRVWRVAVDSVDSCLANRGGPGARRGRPSGSIATLVAEVSLLRGRLDALEAAAEQERVAAPSRMVLSGLVELLHTEGADSAVRAQNVARATEHLAAILNTNAP